MRKHLDFAAIRRGWNVYYDRMLERMQTPDAREGAKRAFNATPEELGATAIVKTAKDYATKTCRECCYGGHCLGADPDCVCDCKGWTIPR
jgi:hypothetical protein